MKHCLFAVCIGILLPTLAGNVCTWTGKGGNTRWSTAANWDVQPVSGNNDILVFPSASALATENDTAGFSVGGLVFSGTGAKTLSGETVVLAGSYIKAANNGGVADKRSYAISNASPTTISAPLSCTGNAQFLNANVSEPATCNLNCNGKVSVASGKTLVVGDAFAYKRDNTKTLDYVFNGAIDAPEATLKFSQWKSDLYLNGAVDVLHLTFDYPGKPIYLPAFSRSVRVRDKSVAIWYGYMVMRADDTFHDDDMVLDWGNSYFSDGDGYQLNGHSLTIDRLGPAKPNTSRTVPASSRNVTSTDAATLTCRASADSTTLGILNGALSFVWDPKANQTCTFSNRANLTTGTLTVNAGTFRMTGASTFANVPAIRVKAGATFANLSTEASSLKGVTSLHLGAGARFETASMPFAANTVVMHLSSSARLALADGVALSAKLVLVDGVPLAAGTYAASASEGVAALAQIEGTGTLTVSGDTSATIWTGATDLNWNTAANWSQGVPSASTPTYVYKDGTFAINVNAAASAGDLTIEQDTDGTASVNVTAPMALANSTLNLSKGARLAVGNGGRVDYACRTTAEDTDYVVNLHDGGALEINDGGLLVSSNLYGRVYVGKDSALRMNGGALHLAPPPIFVGKDVSHGTVLDVVGGTVALTNATVKLGYNFNDADHLYRYSSITVDAGAKFYAHNTHLRMDQWIWGTIFGTCEAVLSGTTHLDLHQYIRGDFTASHAGETSRVVLLDSARVSGAQEFAVGDNVAGATSYCILKSAGARLDEFAGVRIGCSKGYGEIDVAAGCLVGGGSYGILVGAPSRNGGIASAGCFPEGVLKVTGGCVLTRGQNNSKRPYGLIVGDGSTIPVAGTSRVTGRLEVSDTGVVTNNAVSLLVGIGRAQGTVLLTDGGRFLDTANTPAVIGLAGGAGAWVQRGGTAVFSHDLNVGGASTNQLARGNWTDAYLPESCKTATGTLTVTGGTLTVRGTLYVSRDGEGTVTVGGTGAVTAAAAVFTNTFDAVNAKTYPAHLNYVFGADGCGALNVTGQAALAAGTTITVDLTAYTGRKANFRLLSCAALAAAQEDLTISIVDNRAQGLHLNSVATLEVAADGLHLKVPRGLAVRIR